MFAVEDNLLLQPLLPTVFCFSFATEAQFKSKAKIMRCRIGQTPQNDVCDAIPLRLPVDLQSVLVGGIMKFSVKEFINDKYAKAVNILKDNIKENYYVFYGVRLSEILFPSSEYGSEEFFKEFESINSITLPIIIFDLKEQKPILVISFEEVSDAAVLEEVGIAVIICNNLSDLLTQNSLVVLYEV